ncbi:uncharacterized protein LOC127528323 [Erpetoichthys calabaricus]|uniref:uncharacterized protein LOC127528323 n=1 Tax=Erpetoichthys calabaricus TaxID=27687 RepID=UPI002234CBDF|nr:uncharacterized protein LOC127528323 [Erpetoichthys calabaricus]
MKAYNLLMYHTVLLWLTKHLSGKRCADVPHFSTRLNMLQSSRSSARLAAKRIFKKRICGPSSFTKDVVLLPDANFVVVPRRGTKQWLFDSDHVKNAVEFQKDWDAKMIIEQLRLVFSDKIDSSIQFEILMGLHNKVVKPNLVAGQTLSGFVINKVLYLRPNKTLLQSPDDIIEKCTNSSDNETEHNEGKHCIYEDSHYEMKQ